MKKKTTDGIAVIDIFALLCFALFQLAGALPAHIPQILINREPLRHMVFDVELLGDCDVIVNQLCHM